MAAKVGKNMDKIIKEGRSTTFARIVLIAVLLMATTLLMSCALINSKEETAMESNQRILLEQFDISELSAERIAGAMESVGIGKIESIEINKQYQSFFTFYVIDEKNEKYHLTVGVDGSLATIYKDGPGGEYLWGIEE
jgi:hypothetical protein